MAERVAVVGAGAIGGWAAARLALAGHEVAVLARPGRAAAYSGGITLVDDGGGESLARVSAADDARALGRRDLVILAVKGFALAEAAAAARPLIGPETRILPMMNGVPWWFTDRPLAAVDPDGRIAAALPAEQAIGCVVHLAARREGPARVVVQSLDHLVLGEPGGGLSGRVGALGALFEAAGVPVRLDPDIRRAIWYKLWGNMSTNPLSALTLASTDRLIAECRPLMVAAMAEAKAIGAALGIRIDESPEDRIAVAERLGAFKTSMLQDVEAGRRIELDALLGAPLELARRHGVATPTLDTIHAMTRLMAERRGLL